MYSFDCSINGKSILSLQMFYKVLTLDQPVVLSIYVVDLHQTLE